MVCANLTVVIISGCGGINIQDSLPVVIACLSLAFLNPRGRFSD
jgi:hypothetical protein